MEQKKFFKLMMMVISLSLITLLLISCSTLATARDIPQSLILSGNDINVGEVLTAELNYSKDETLKERLIAEALKGTNYDFLLMPRYEIVPGIVKKMRVRGRGARVK